MLKIIHYIVSYSIKKYLGLYLPLATGNLKATNISKKKGPYTGGGEHSLFTTTGGKQRIWVGPLVYMLKETLRNATIGMAKG